MKMKLTLLAMGLLAACAGPGRGSGPVTFGAIADCQYADADPSGQRLYRRSPEKLRACVAGLDAEEFDFVVHLGDLIDRDWESYDVVVPILDGVDGDVHVVLGNHEFSVAEEHKRAVPERLGLERRYYEFAHRGWRFVVLDGNELSSYAWPEGSPEYDAGQEWYAEHAAGRPEWNGALGPEQRAWLDEVLTRADDAGERVILFCHFPVLPENEDLNLWDEAQVRPLLARHPSVKAWLNGHEHAGGYAELDGIHYLTLHGMVDTEETAWAVVTLDGDTLRVDGRGREPDRLLRLR